MANKNNKQYVFKEVIDLKERVAKLEVCVEDVKGSMNELARRVEALDSRLWAILSGVIFSILLQIVLRCI